MYVKSIAATDYSTGTQYTYSGTTGNWESIQAAGGKVNPSGGSGSSKVDSAAPAVTSLSNSAPIPFDGTHRSDSTYATPSVYPWVASATTLQTSTASATNYPSLPSGWTVSSSGKVIPPSAAPVSEPPLQHHCLFDVWRCIKLTVRRVVHIPTSTIYLIASGLATGFFLGCW